MDAKPPRQNNALPNIIDLESSGLCSNSYPIEVGLVRGDGARYCALITPAPEWTHWDQDAGSLHGIKRENLLSNGKPPKQVASELNALLQGQVAYSDGWVVDKPWLIALFHAARTDMEFQISPLEAILSETQMACWHSTKESVINEHQVTRHRASSDAWVIQETFRRTAPNPTTQNH